MSETLLLNCIFQRLNDVILAENVIEYLGPIFSRKDLVTHGDNVVSCRDTARSHKLLRFEYRASAYIQNRRGRNYFQPSALFSFAALAELFRDRHILLGRYYRARTREFHRGHEN